MKAQLNKIHIHTTLQHYVCNEVRRGIYRMKSTSLFCKPIRIKYAITSHQHYVYVYSIYIPEYNKIS
jgi:hypothetical protein